MSAAELRSPLRFEAFMRRAWMAPRSCPAVVSQERPVPALAKAGSERLEDAALGGIFCKTPIASDCLTEFRNVLNTLQFIGEWCNGSTTDSDSVCLGSNPSSPATIKLLNILANLDNNEV